VPVDNESLVGHAALTLEPVVIADAYDLPATAHMILDLSFDERYHYRRRSMLIVPMVDHRGRLVGVLGFINRKTEPSARIATKEDADRWVVPYSDREVMMARMLASLAAVSLENAALYAQVEYAFERFVKAAVTAIDERDPTTAGHSLRVAALSTALAEAAIRTDDGTYRDVRFTPRRLRELRFAAMLHDFGKVAVRENVLVKAKKLPPVLWERVTARFDLIRETLEAEHYRSAAPPNASPDAKLKEQLERLEQIRGIVRAANEPTVLTKEPAAQLREIAELTYTAADGSPAPYLTPEELHYLEIPKGTLDDGERAEIQSHPAQTHRFLADIPWPDDLAELATYASGHHEKLDGTGYPRHLKGDEIPLQTRIITIADMFDALTASDRPYKPAIAAEKALDILHDEAKAGRVDADLVRIMAESRAYREALEGDWRQF
jgi:HD-GYP domain-containing protein (c-di-GMP phosphodiesterase class II)